MISVEIDRGGKRVQIIYLKALKTFVPNQFLIISYRQLRNEYTVHIKQICFLHSIFVFLCPLTGLLAISGACGSGSKNPIYFSHRYCYMTHS